MMAIKLFLALALAVCAAAARLEHASAVARNLEPLDFRLTTRASVPGTEALARGLDEARVPHGRAINVRFSAWGNDYDLDLALQDDIVKTDAVVRTNDGTSSRPARFVSYAGRMADGGRVRATVHGDAEHVHLVFHEQGELRIVESVEAHRPSLSAASRRHVEEHAVTHVAYRHADVVDQGSSWAWVEAWTAQQTSPRALQRTAEAAPEGPQRLRKTLQFDMYEDSAYIPNDGPYGLLADCPSQLYIADYGMAHNYGYAKQVSATDDSASTSTVVDVDLVESTTQQMVNIVNMLYTDQVNLFIRIAEFDVRTQADTTAWNQEPDDFSFSGSEKTTLGCPISDDIYTHLDDFTNWYRTKSFANKFNGWHLLTHCFPSPGTVGLAYVSATASSLYATGWSSWSKNTYETFAHELGHNIGASHAVDANNNVVSSDGGLMSYDSSAEFYFKNEITIPSDVCDHISSISTGYLTVSEATCGNDVVEPGEECDDDSACCSSCALTAQCSAADNECCQSDCLFKPHFNLCNGGNGFCASGVCTGGNYCGYYSNTACCYDNSVVCKEAYYSDSNSACRASSANIASGVVCATSSDGGYYGECNGAGSCVAATAPSTGSITVTAPTSAATWVHDTSYDITWTSESAGSQVSITLSTGTLLVADTSNDGSYTFTPTTGTVPAGDYTLTITDGTFSGTSDVFAVEVVPTLSFSSDVASPLTVGETTTISWDVAGSPALINVLLLEGGVETGTTIAAGLSGSATSTSWTVDVAASTDYSVKIDDGANALATSNTFTVQDAPTLSVTSPTAASEWTVGETYTVSWTYSGAVSAVDVVLVASSNGAETTIGSSVAVADLSLSHTVSVGAGTYAVRVDDGSVSDTSGEFDILAAPVPLDVTEPASGAVWWVGEQVVVGWAGDDAYDIDLYAGTTLSQSLATAVTGGSLTLTCPDVDEGTDYVVRLSGTTNGEEESSDAFSILVQPTLSGVTLASGFWTHNDASQQVTWTATGSTASAEAVLYLHDADDNVQLAVLGTVADVADETFDVNVVDTLPGGLVYVRVAADALGLEASSVDFALRGVVAVTAPSASDSVFASQSIDIAFTDSASIGTYDMLVHKGSAQIFSGTASSTWTPDIDVEPGTDYTVTVTDTVVGGTGTSAEFEVLELPVINVLAPTSYDVVWTKGETYTVSLDTTSTDVRVTILASDGSANEAATTYTVPTTIATGPAEIVFLDWTGSLVSASGYMTIADVPVVITVDDVADTVINGETTTVSWTFTGAPTAINVVLYADGASTGVIVAADLDPYTVVDFDWTPTGVAAGTAYTLHVSDASSGSSALSNTFEIKDAKSLSIVSPTAWTIGETYTVSWGYTSTGYDWSVQVWLVNAQGAEESLGTVLASAESVTVTVDQTSGTYTLRVEYVDDTGLFSASSEFAITDAAVPLGVTEPTAVSQWYAGSTVSVSWTGDDSYDIELLKNGAAVSTLVSGATGGSASVTLGDDLAAGDDYQVRLSGVSGGEVDTTDAFEVLIPLSLSAAALDSALWFLGDADLVVGFSTTGVVSGSVTLTLHDAETTAEVADLATVADISAASSATFDLPLSVPIGLYYVRILSEALELEANTEDVRVAGVVTMTAPDAGDVLYVGQAVQCAWTDTGGEGSYVFSASYNGNEVFTETTTSTSFTYTLTEAIDTITVIGSSVADVDAAGASVTVSVDAEPTVTVSYPTSTDEEWSLGATYSATWAYEGPIVDVDVTLVNAADGTVVFSDSVAASAGAVSIAVPDDAAEGAHYLDVQSSDVEQVDGTFNNGDAWRGFVTLVDTTEPAIVVADVASSVMVGDAITVSWTHEGLSSASTRSVALLGPDDFELGIATATAEDEVDWVVDAPAGSDYRFVVIDVASTTEAYSGYFDITEEPSVAVTTPSGWSIGSSYSLTWTYTGALSTVTVYLVDSQGTERVLVAGVAIDAGTATYEVEADVAKGVGYTLLIVADSGDQAVSGSFAISAAAVPLSITAPTETTVWVSGETVAVQWAGDDSYLIELLKAGDVVDTLVSGAAGGSASVVVSDAWEAGVDYTVRLSGEGEEGEVEESDQFTVEVHVVDGISNVQVSSSALVYGQSYTVSWDWTGDVAAVDVMVGATTVASDVVNTGSTTVKVDSDWPQEVTASLRVLSSASASVYATTEEEVEVQSTLAVLSPVEGATLFNAVEAAFSWSDSMTEGGPYTLVVSRDGTSVSTYAASSTSHTLYIGLTVGSNYILTVSSDQSGRSASVGFAVQDKDQVLMAYPAYDVDEGDADEWQQGQSVEIGWTTKGSVDAVTVSITDSAGVVQVEQGVTNSGAFAWVVPSTMALGACAVEVTCDDCAEDSTTSTGVAVIAAAPEVDSGSVVAPAAGASVTRSLSYWVQWEGFSTASTVSVELRRYDGTSHSTVATLVTDVDNANAWEWVVSEEIAVGTNYYLRLTPDDDSTAPTTDSGFFNIVAQPAWIEVTNVFEGQDGDQWLRGAVATIEFSVYDVDTVDIALWKNGKEQYVIAEDVSASVEAFEFTVPFMAPPSLGTAYFLRVSDSSSASLYDTYATPVELSDVTLSSEGDDDDVLAPSITSVTAPAAGVEIITGSVVTVSWTSEYVSEVDIALVSFTSGSVISTLVQGLESTGSYAWAVSEGLPEGTEYALTVSSSSSSTASITTEAFTIVTTAGGTPVLSISAPTSASAWVVDSDVTVAWEGAFLSAPLELLVADTQVADQLPSEGSLTFALTASMAAAVMGADGQGELTVTLQSDEVSATSPTFAVGAYPSLNFTAPVDHPRWAKGASHYFRWDSFGFPFPIVGHLYRGTYGRQTVTGDVCLDYVNADGEAQSGCAIAEYDASLEICATAVTAAGLMSDSGVCADLGEHLTLVSSDLVTSSSANGKHYFEIPEARTDLPSPGTYYMLQLINGDNGDAFYSGHFDVRYPPVSVTFRMGLGEGEVGAEGSSERETWVANLIDSLAALLGIDASRISVGSVSTSTSTSTGGVRRLLDDATTVEIVVDSTTSIEDDPAEDVGNEFAALVSDESSSLYNDTLLAAVDPSYEVVVTEIDTSDVSEETDDDDSGADDDDVLLGYGWGDIQLAGAGLGGLIVLVAGAVAVKRKLSPSSAPTKEERSRLHLDSTDGPGIRMTTFNGVEAVVPTAAVNPMYTSNSKFRVGSGRKAKPLPAGWFSATADTGAVYYYNATSGETRWDRPT